MTLSGSFGTPSNPHSFAFQRVDQVGLPREHDPYAFFPDDADVDRRDHHRLVVAGKLFLSRLISFLAESFLSCLGLRPPFLEFLLPDRAHPLVLLALGFVENLIGLPKQLHGNRDVPLKFNGKQKTAGAVHLDLFKCDQRDLGWSD
jgi:hypothetical protein